MDKLKEMKPGRATSGQEVKGATPRAYETHPQPRGKDSALARGTVNKNVKNVRGK